MKQIDNKVNKQEMLIDDLQATQADLDKEAEVVQAIINHLNITQYEDIESNNFRDSTLIQELIETQANNTDVLKSIEIEIEILKQFQNELLDEMENKREDYRNCLCLKNKFNNFNNFNIKLIIIN